MAQSLSRLWTHLIFSTKERFPFLRDHEIRREMDAYLATVLRSHDCETIIVGGARDHVHCLFALSRKYSISTVVKEIKRTSSSWVKDISNHHRKFHWQNGYGAFSASQSHLNQVCRYVESQEPHHQRISFQDEYRAFLRKYKVKFDDMYGSDFRELFQSSSLPKIFCPRALPWARTGERLRRSLVLCTYTVWLASNERLRRNCERISA